MTLRYSELSSGPDQADDPGPDQSERGAILLLTIFMLAAILAVGALALDSAQVYRTRLTLQKAADAGVMAALRKRAELGYPPTAVPSAATTANGGVAMEIKTAAHLAAKLNLAMSGRTTSMVDTAQECTLGQTCMIFSYTTFQSTGDRNLDDVVRIEMVSPVRLLLMNLVPFDILGLGRGPSSSTVRLQASARPQRVNISLLLDSSASMKCPSQLDDCSCRLTPGGCAGLRLKIDDLRDAVDMFTKRYNPNRDRISVITFNSLAQMNLGMQQASGFAPGSLSAAVDALSEANSRGDTNICDAFIQDFTERKRLADLQLGAGLPSAVLNSDAEINEVVLFSDGAPTAGRFCFAPFAAQCQNDRSQDLCLFAIKLAVGSGPALETVSPPLSCAALANRPIDIGAMSYPVGTADLGGNPGARAACATFGSGGTALSQMMAGCAADLSFVVPTEQGSTLSPMPLDNWRDQFAHCPIVWSDLLRKNKVTINAIGLGMPPNLLAIGPPPAGQINPSGQDDYRQDHLLSRMTGDQGWYRGEPRTVWPPNYPPFNYLSPQTMSLFSELDDTSLPLQYREYRGVYYAAQSTADLPAMFRLLGLHIGSKLTQ